MGGKGGDESFTQGAANNSGPLMRGMVGQQAPTNTGDVVLPPPTPDPDPVMPTQGDDAKTPGPTTPGSGADDPGGGGATDTPTDTGSQAAQLLSAPSYWFNQPISTLKPITKKSGSIKTTGSV